MKAVRYNLYYGLLLAATAVGSFKVASFFVSDSTKFDLQPVDWDGVGALMSGIGALATIAAAWAATLASRAALKLARETAEADRFRRNRRALAAQLQIHNELDIVISRLDSALKVIGDDHSMNAFQRSITQMRKTRLDVTNRCLVEADIFEPLFAVQLSIVSSADRKIKEIFGSTDDDGQVTHIEAIDFYNSLAINYRDTAKVARDEARKVFSVTTQPEDRSTNN